MKTKLRSDPAGSLQRNNPEDQRRAFSYVSVSVACGGKGTFGERRTLVVEQSERRNVGRIEPPVGRNAGSLSLQRPTPLRRHDDDAAAPLVSAAFVQSGKSRETQGPFKVSQQAFEAESASRRQGAAIIVR